MVLSRAAYLQLVPDHRLQSLEKRQFETAVTLQGRRGDVFDRNAHELAASVTTYSIFADPKMLDEPRRVARVLSRELKTPYAALEERFRNKKRRFVWLERHLNKAASTAVTEALDAEFKHQKIHGIGVVEESQRLYPNDKLLAPVLGFVGDDGNGLEGLELALNSQLQGEKKTVNLQRDARGRPLIVAGQMFNQAPEGEDIVLTIDRELQFVL